MQRASAESTVSRFLPHAIAIPACASACAASLCIAPLPAGAQNGKGWGALFRVTPAGEVSVIASGAPFKGPRRVVVDNAGDFVLSDTDSTGVLYKVTPAGAVTSFDLAPKINACVNALGIDADGNYIVRMRDYGGLDRYSPAGEYTRVAGSVGGNTVYDLAVDYSGNYICSVYQSFTWSGLLGISSINPEDGTWHYLYSAGSTSILAHFSALAPEADGTIVLGMFGTLYRWDPASPGTITRIVENLPLDDITAIAVDDAGAFIVTDGGHLHRHAGGLFRVSSTGIASVVDDATSPLIAPSDVALDADGNYIVADRLAGPPLYIALPSGTEYGSGEYIHADVVVQAIDRSFDAWALVQTPGGDYYTIILDPPDSWDLSLTLKQGAGATLKGIGGLSAYVETPLLNGHLPEGVKPGSYTIIAGLVPAGVTPTGPENAIPGYIDTVTIEVR